MANPRIQFRFDEEMTKLILGTLQHPIPEGTSDNIRDTIYTEKVREILGDYIYFLRQSLPKFSLNEAMLLIDALNGIIIHAQTAQYLWVEIRSAIKMDQLDQKWEVDGDALLIRLEDLGQHNPFACYAIAHAVSQAWNAPEYYITDMRERVVQVGLVQKEDAQEKERRTK